MADKKKEKQNKNSVIIVGYLKENNLEKVSNPEKGDIIRGSLLIAVDESKSYKVEYYVPSTTKDGESSQTYTDLLELLPESTTSIASFLKDNPGSDYEMASNAADKVWASARLEEFASESDGRSISLVKLKGFKAGFKTATDASPFTPHANFEETIYIKDIKKEITYADENDEEGTETGRVIINGLIPVYDDSVYVVDFVAPTENNIANTILSLYSKGDTVTIKGELVNIVKKVLQEEEEEEEFFGVPSGPQYRTIFINERVILGGSKNPIHQGEEGSITNAFVKEGLAKRLTKMKENGKKAASGKGSRGTTASKADTKKEFAEDMDF